MKYKIWRSINNVETPRKKFVSYQKNKWYIEKKDNRALKFKQTMATNLGNTRSSVENHLDAWRPPSWNSFLDPRFPLRATRDSANRSHFSRACVALHTRPPTSALRLRSLARKRRKNNACFSGYWSRVLRFFDKNTISVSGIKDNQIYGPLGFCFIQFGSEC